MARMQNMGRDARENVPDDPTVVLTPRSGATF
jgi:hypothetical protein